MFHGKTLRYNRIAYNNRAERAVEIPLAFDFLATHRHDGPILEIGNVLQHYENALSDAFGIRSRCIVDKFEVGDGIENRDIMDIDFREKYQVIVSVSTVEHVGQNVNPSGLFGEHSQVTDREAPLKAIAKMYDLLAPGGHALLTVPFGVLTDGGWYIQFSTDYLNLLVTKYGLPHDALSVGFLRCIERASTWCNPAQVWIEAAGEEVADIRYDTIGGGARAIGVIRLTKNSSPYTLTLVAPPTPLFYRQSPLVKRLSFVIGVLFSRRHHDEPLHRVAPDLGVG
ncbi:MAG: hypothetical protein NVSMB54_25590 [Ktedonobacteraceae bacterium]